jgi:phage tail-like protein
MSAYFQHSDDDPEARYLIEIEHLVVGVFREAEGLHAKRERLDIQEGGRTEVLSRLGPYVEGVFTLRDGEADVPDLFRWMERGRGGAVFASSRRSGAVILVDGAGQELMRWRFKMGVVSDWEGPAREPAPGETHAIEKIEIAHEGLEWVIRSR